MTKKADHPPVRMRANDANEFIIVHHDRTEKEVRKSGNMYIPHLHEHTIRKSWIVRWTRSEYDEPNRTRLFFKDGTSMTIVQSYDQITDCMLLEVE